MSDRDRLIELIRRAKTEVVCCTSDDEPVRKWQRNIVDRAEANDIADYLLANGVIVPPCYIGQTVYQLYEKYNGDFIIRQGEVSAIQQKADKSWKIRITHNSSVWELKIEDIGVRYFLTKEEAEEKLKELNNG